MSKSYWMEDQNGNFSNNQEDTFNPEKRYVGIRLQQGVPLLDRDWNELEDLRRYEEMILRKWYVGDGVPAGDDGFKISHVTGDYNFRIAKGRCLVNGFEAVNEPPDEAEYILYSQQEGVGDLTPPHGIKTDIVYLDVWIEEVTSEEDEALGNSQDVNIETCIRHKLEWRVRVRDKNELSIGYKKGSHNYYDIAKIWWGMPSELIISNPTIEDLRNTGLSLAEHEHSKLIGADGSPDPALSVDNAGNVGIGTTGPTQALSIGAGNVLLPTANQGTDGNLYFGGITNNGEVGLRLFGGVVNGTIPAGFIDVKTTDDNDGLRIRVDKDEAATERMRITAKGNVGIGTATPGYKLTVNGSAAKTTGSFWTSISDKRLKKNIKQLKGALGKLLKLRGVSYKWKEPKKFGGLTGKQMGLIAQEVEKVFPEWVDKAPDKYKNLTITGFEALTIEAFRELKEENNKLKSKNKEFETRIKALEKKLTAGK